MYKYFQQRLALSEQGAKDFVKGVGFTTLLNISLMFPAILVFFFLQDYLQSYFGTSASVVNNGFWHYTLMGLGFMLLMWMIARWQYQSTYTRIYDESANRRISLAEKLRVLPLAFFGEKNLSDLTSTIMSDSTDLEHTFSHTVPQLFASILSICLIAVGLFTYNWQMATALLWVVPIAAMVLILAKRFIRRENKINYESKREVTDHIQEGLDNIQEIKAYSREDAYIDELDDRLQTYEKKLIRSELWAGALVNSSQSLLKLGLASVILGGAALLDKGSIDLFTYMIFLMISASIYNPISDVFNNLAALLYLDIRIKRMNEMEALPIQQGKTEFEPKSYHIRFEDVSFSYESGKQVLSKVNFTAEQGEITALVGPSGGGKSTSAKLAARFWDIQGGKIFLGDQDISKIDPETLLQHYAVVFQDVVLFNASISDNIRIGKRDASDEEVMRVARLAQCDDFVRKLPQGYATIIGENGETLSGGERQRISIARALLKDAPIVLLDEATASLDVENETRIQAGISELIKDKTVLIIAHRMRTVANADKIVVLNEGKVQEIGSPEELLRNPGLFAEMLRKQSLSNPLPSAAL